MPLSPQAEAELVQGARVILGLAPSGASPLVLVAQIEDPSASILRVTPTGHPSIVVLKRDIAGWDVHSGNPDQIAQSLAGWYAAGFWPHVSMPAS